MASIDGYTGLLTGTSNDEQPAGRRQWLRPAAGALAAATLLLMGVAVGGQTSQPAATLTLGAIDANRQNILVNKKKLYEMETVVMNNEFVAYEHRAIIEENRELLLKNYDAAFNGNRQMANFNTDEIFENKKAILGSLVVAGVGGDVELNCKDSMLNEAKVDYLDHRSVLNGHVAEVSKIMAAANSRLIDANEKTMVGNGMNTAFNSKHIGINSQLIDGSLNSNDATPETNAKRVASNVARMKEIKERAAANTDEMEANDLILMHNDESIKNNAKLISQRRSQIVEDHAEMMLNSEKVSSLFASWQSSPASSNAAVVEANTREILGNKKKLYDLGMVVLNNKFLAYEHRSMIEENRDLLLKNYEAAFRGNRQMSNFNTQQIFQNRDTILASMQHAISGSGAPSWDSADQVSVNWVNSMINEAHVDFLEHRSELNGRVANVNKIIADANTQLIAANDKIMASNEMITAFNIKHIGINRELLNGGLNDQQYATPATNAKRIASNAARMTVIGDRAAANSDIMKANLATLTGNSEDIEKNAELISKRREATKHNHVLLMENAQKIAGMIH